MNISYPILILSVIGLTSLASGQESRLLPSEALAPSSLASSALGRGLEPTKLGPVDNQQTCPQALGDAWDTRSQLAWNILEVGVQIKPEQKPAPELQLYTRYTCPRAPDRPGGLVGR